MGVLGYKWRIQAIGEHALGQFPHSISFAFCQAFGVTFFFRSCQLICPVSFCCHILNVFGTFLRGKFINFRRIKQLFKA